jgi:hypothetical protein
MTGPYTESMSDKQVCKHLEEMATFSFTMKAVGFASAAKTATAAAALAINITPTVQAPDATHKLERAGRDYQYVPLQSYSPSPLSRRRPITADGAFVMRASCFRMDPRTDSGKSSASARLM